MLLSFGKYKGQDLSSVPEDYIEWLVDKARNDVATYEGELERRILIREADETIAAQIVEAGFKVLAKKYHPDVGGDPAKMRELLATREKMRQQKL